MASVASFYRGLGSEVGNDWGNQIIQTSDNGHIVTGGTESFGSGRQDMLLAKYDSNNNLSWSRTWGGEYDDWGNAIIQTNDGGYAITGVTKSYGAGNEDMFLTKFSSDGSLIWSKTWGELIKKWALN